jgi:hypothetical protein
VQRAGRAGRETGANRFFIRTKSPVVHSGFSNIFYYKPQERFSVRERFNERGIFWNGTVVPIPLSP